MTRPFVLNLSKRMVIVAAFCALLGCGILPHRLHDHEGKKVDAPWANIIMVNARGNPVDPTGNIPVSCRRKDDKDWCDGLHTSLNDYDEIDQSKFEEQLHDMVKNIRIRIPERKRKVLIFVHGGLNTQAETVQRAAALRSEIEKDGYYPIFVNWQSSLVTSYKDHLVHIRQGEFWGHTTWGTVAGLVTSPFYLAADVARALVRAPVVWFFQFRNDLQTATALRPLWHRDRLLSDEVAADLLCEYDPDAFARYYGPDSGRICDQSLVSPKPGGAAQPIPIWTGTDNRTWDEKIYALLTYWATTPAKLAIAPFLDAFGKSSWDNMLRSTSTLFHSDDEYNQFVGPNSPSKPQGGLSRLKKAGPLSLFLLKLQDEVCGKPGSPATPPKDPCPGKDAWEITLVGHSMGTIILNEMLRLFDELPFKDIVYMAAACTIRDYESSAFPYLRKNGHATVHHLTLQEAAESREMWNEYTLTVDLPPRGSLLVWVDNFLQNPLDKMGRTLGRFTNLMGAVHHTPEELRHQIKIKKFPVGAKGTTIEAGPPYPQKHGEFTDPFHFWEPKCWSLPAPQTPVEKIAGDLKDCVRPLNEQPH